MKNTLSIFFKAVLCGASPFAWFGFVRAIQMNLAQESWHLLPWNVAGALVLTGLTMLAARDLLVEAILAIDGMFPPKDGGGIP
jgi:hypothetical protein